MRSKKPARFLLARSCPYILNFHMIKSVQERICLHFEFVTQEQNYEFVIVQRLINTNFSVENFCLVHKPK